VVLPANPVQLPTVPYRKESKIRRREKDA
jgi:hypothetical protein